LDKISGEPNTLSDFDRSLDDFCENSFDVSSERSSPFPTIDEVIERAKIIFSALGKGEWDLYIHHQESRNEEEGQRIEEFVSKPEEEQLGIEEETIDQSINGDAAIDSDDVVKAGNNDSLDVDVINELILGSSLSKWRLTVVELNAMLLHVATSTFSDKEDIMLKIFHHMKELENIGLKQSAPNADTYTIILTFSQRSGHCSISAVDIASMMLENAPPEDELGMEQAILQNDDDFILERDTLEVAMNVFVEQLDIKSAEKLLQWALNQGVYIHPVTFRSILNLYKSHDNQEKALEIIQKCIEVRGHISSMNCDVFFTNDIKKCFARSGDA
jgi:hypothetical protein